MEIFLLSIYSAYNISFIGNIHRSEGRNFIIGLIYMMTLNPGGGTPLNGLYRYVPRNRVWFLEVLDP